MKRAIITLMVGLLAMALFAQPALTSPNGHEYDGMYEDYNDFEFTNSSLTFDVGIVLMMLGGQNPIPHGGIAANNLPSYVTTSSQMDLDIDVSISCWPDVYYDCIEFEILIDGIQVVELSLDSDTHIYESISWPDNGWGAHTIEIRGTWEGYMVGEDGSPIGVDTELQGTSQGFDTAPENTVYENNYAQANFDDELYVLQQSDNTIKKPILIIEGFDPLNLSGMSRYYELLEPALDEFDEYDVYFLNFGEGGRDLRDNAMSVLGALDFLGTYYEDNYSYFEGIKAMGISMGGVILRYALAYAEENSIDHYCTQFISCDSPQRGSIMNHQFQWAIHNFNDDRPDPALHLFKSLLQSTAAKQLLRHNIYAVGYEGYAYTGTQDFIDFFSEINAEERLLFPGNPILNTDDTYPGSKPGFPYKQHNIQSLAVSNGMLTRSGNLNSHEHIIHWWYFDLFDLVTRHYWADSQDYDTQPGSTSGLDDLPFPGAFWFPFNWIQWADVDPPNYDPVFMPLKSALYLVVEQPENPGVTNDQFLISDFSEIEIDAGCDAEDYLASYSHFDQVNFQLPERYLHEYLSDDSINKLVEWIGDPYLNAVGYINGQIEGSSPGGSIAKLYYEDILLSTGYVEEDGTFNIPYTIMGDADVRLEITKSDYYPIDIPVNVAYSLETIQYDPITATQVYYNPYMLIVNPDGVGFNTIPYAIDIAYNFTTSDDYDGNEIQIVVADGTYDPFIVSLFEDTILRIRGLQGGEVIIDGTMNSSPGIIVKENTNCAITIQNMTIQDSNKGAIVVDYDIPPELPEYASQVCSYTFENLTIQNNDNGYVLGDNEAGASGGITVYGYDTECEINIKNCEFDNNISMIDNSCDLRHGYGGAVYVNGEIDVIFEGNVFTDNSAYRDGGAVYVTGATSVNIDNNTFTGNHLTALSSDNLPYDCSVLYAEDCESLYLNGNIFHDNLPGTHGSINLGDHVFQFGNCTNAQIINNTFADNPDLTGLRFGGVSSLSLFNSIFTGNETGISKSNGPPPDIGYCLFYDNEVHSSGVEITNSFVDVDPQYADPANGDYSLLWNETTRSVCIDAGDPDTDGDGHHWYRD
ncbi:MAG: hypothetical protein K8R90_00595, partial [Candidatus Cloacimonetes bacterium]|nr:hypothetical protein [Candidatus Cloacimonadota bacterium]